MSIDCMNEVLAALVTATPDRKAAALRVLRGDEAVMPRRTDTEPFLTLREAGRRLGLSPCSLWRWQVPRHVLGGRPRFRLSEIEKYLASENFQRLAAEIRKQDRERRAAKTVKQ
jgi:predicted DNA-binding transcriptional regulator AlpA